MGSFSERLRTALDEAGMKPPDLVRKLGLTRVAIKYWLDGTTRHIRPEHLFPLARLLNVNPEWLGNGSGEKRSSVHLDARQEEAVYTVLTLGQEEKELLGLFASLSDTQRKTLLDFLAQIQSTEKSKQPGNRVR